MKTFPQFIFECYYIIEGRKKTPTYSDEYANINFYNYLVSSPDIRKLIGNKDYKSINQIISQEIENSKSDINHPLHFNNASDEGFSGKKKTENHQNSYYSQIERSGPGFLSLIQSKKGGSIASKGWVGKVSGGEHEASKSSWKGNVKGQGRFDYVFSDPEDSKKLHRVSGKDYRGSQAGSAQADQATATLERGVEVAAQQQVKSILANKPKKKSEETEQEYKERVAQLKLDARNQGKEMVSTSQETLNKIKELMASTKGMPPKQQKDVYTQVQAEIDGLEKKVPGVQRAAGQEMLQGRGQFSKGKTAQSMWTTGGEGASFRDPRQQSVGLRARAGKGGGREMAVAGDILAAPKEKEQQKKRQSTFASFSKKAEEAQQAAEAQAQAELTQAEKAKERAEKIIGPGGKRVLRQYVGAFLANNPDKAQQRSLKISAAQQNIDASTANINSIQQQKADAQAALTPEQPQPSTPEQVPPEQQQQQAPPPEQVPPEQQQQQAPPPEQVPPEQQQQQAAPPEEQQVQPEQKPKKKRKVEPENVEQTTEPVA